MAQRLRRGEARSFAEGCRKSVVEGAAIATGRPTSTEWATLLRGGGARAHLRRRRPRREARARPRPRSATASAARATRAAPARTGRPRASATGPRARCRARRSRSSTWTTSPTARVCLADALDGAALEAAWGDAPPARPGRRPRRRRWPARRTSRRQRRGLTADWTQALAKCEKANASGKQRARRLRRRPRRREGAGEGAPRARALRGSLGPRGLRRGRGRGRRAGVPPAGARGAGDRLRGSDLPVKRAALLLAALSAARARALPRPRGPSTSRR